MNKRRKFLKTACAPVVLSMCGVSIIEACSTEDNADTSAVNSNNSSNNGSSSNNSSSNNSSGLKIDLNDSKFSNLAVVGGWMNYQTGLITS